MNSEQENQNKTWLTLLAGFCNKGILPPESLYSPKIRRQLTDEGRQKRNMKRPVGLHSTLHGEAHHPPTTGLLGGLAEMLHLPGHTHSHEQPGRRDAMFTNREGTRALTWSLALLGATTVLQFIVYAASGSVALLADTIHNLGDALNSVPLLIAFWLARRPANQRYTYGFGRAEDLGGLLVVVSIVFSAVYILWEVAQKLIHPIPIQNSGWVLAAAILGFLGNEAVAIIETRTGKRIGSAAMVVDGRHARIDGLTSLAVIPAVIGSAIGLPILDPIFGVLIGIAILFITVHATVAIWYRLMDAVDPELNEKVRIVLSESPQVTQISTLRMRWVGHELWVEGQLVLDAALTRLQTEQLLHQVKHDLEQRIHNLGEVNLSSVRR
jgi:cation diffusion facilitator family transporter